MASDSEAPFEVARELPLDDPPPDIAMPAMAGAAVDE